MVEIDFGQVYEKYHDVVDRVVRRISLRGGVHAPEDFVQMTFLNALKRFAFFDPSKSTAQDPLQSWLLTIATNTVLAAGRSLRRSPDALLLIDDYINPFSDVSFSQLEIGDELAGIVANARLTEAEREVLDLQYDKGYEPLEIAQMIGISHHTARTRRYRAIKKLRQAARQSPKE